MMTVKTESATDMVIGVRKLIEKLVMSFVTMKAHYELTTFMFAVCPYCKFNSQRLHVICEYPNYAQCSTLYNHP